MTVDDRAVYDERHRQARTFAVHEQQGGMSSVTFAWKVGAHPQAQKSERLKKFVAPPPLHLPTADELPKPPAAPSVQKP